MRYPSFRIDSHYGVKQPEFNLAVQALVKALEDDRGVFIADNLITFGRNLGFLDDEPLMKAWKTHCEGRERAVLWRTANLAWAARHAARLEGDFVECGVFRGVTASIVADLVDLSGRTFWLYDAFGDVPGQKTLEGMHEGREAEVRERFANMPQVKVIKGIVPDSFAQGLPDKVAFAHIDMNNPDPEIAALEALATRLVPGAAIVLDDYGWFAYGKQFLAERDWFAARGRSVMEMPTGQGLVIW